MGLVADLTQPCKDLVNLKRGGNYLILMKQSSILKKKEWNIVSKKLFGGR